MWQFHLKISKIDENINMIFISAVKLTSDSDVALNKRVACHSHRTVFCV